MKESELNKQNVEMKTRNLWIIESKNVKLKQKTMKNSEKRRIYYFVSIH